VVYGVPLGGFGTTVVFSVGTEAEGSDWFSGRGYVVYVAPHFDGRGSAVDFAI
jgi:hypothetical protein